ncbi:tyrosine-type recombinase/integrase [Leucobacter sp. USHLN154]|uniref:tyrosine-type recombinase/integrase n=1 Tax=Leucobacter sp. USHLN154 TaxID=3081269 RepID=UPI003018B41B
MEISGEHRDRALIYLLASAGPRIGEATALRVGDIRVDARRADIRRTWTTTTKGARAVGPPKTWETRAIPLHDYVLDELAPLMEEQESDAWLFRMQRGGAAIDQRNWRGRVWIPALEAAGLGRRGLTPHKLRHTAASAAIAADADPLVIQTLLGRKTAKETIRMYAHLWPDRLDDVIAAVTRHREEALDRSDGARSSLSLSGHHGNSTYADNDPSISNAQRLLLQISGAFGSIHPEVSLLIPIS